MDSTNALFDDSDSDDASTESTPHTGKRPLFASTVANKKPCPAPSKPVAAKTSKKPVNTIKKAPKKKPAGLSPKIKVERAMSAENKAEALKLIKDFNAKRQNVPPCSGGGRNKLAVRQAAECKAKWEQEYNAEGKCNIAMLSNTHAYRTEKCYKTNIAVGIKQESVVTYTLADALDAHKLKRKIEGELGGSKLKNGNKAHYAREVANVATRGANREKFGNTSQQERDAVVRTAPVVEERTANDGSQALETFVSDDGTKSDLLFRTKELAKDEACLEAAMLKGDSEGLWLMNQTKTTMHKNDDAQYHFTDTKGYPGMLVTCQALQDAPKDVHKHRFWLLDGTTVQNHTGITISTKRDPSATSPASTGSVKPCSVQGLARRMQLECTKALASFKSATPDPTALKLVTNTEAKSMVGCNNKVEHEGIALYKRVVLEASGYESRSSDKQNGKVDLQVRENSAAKWKNYQFKTVQKSANAYGSEHWNVGLATHNGRGNLPRNTYKPGDNDYYVCVLPPGAANGIAGKLLVWEIPESAMEKYGKLGKGASGRMSLYDKEAYNTKDGTDKWTYKYFTEYML